MSNKYEQQALHFLRKYNISCEINYLKNDYHFADDKETRDIYSVTFRKFGKSFSIAFGDSINNTLKNQHKLSRIKPTFYDILSCLQKYDVGSFEDFIDDFGYELPNGDAVKKARIIYWNCKNEFKKVSDFFTSEELEELLEIN